VIPFDTDTKNGRRLLGSLPEKHWIIPEPVKGSLEKPEEATFADDAILRYPGELRKTLCIQGENVLVEAVFQTGDGLTNAGLMGKYDGKNGYRLIVNGSGRAEFQLASDGELANVASSQKVNDGDYYHVVAEADRATGRMTIYVNGKEAGTDNGAPKPEQSIDNGADFLVGKTHDGQFFKGRIDTMRVAQGTLEQARTDIDEIYAWFTDGPWRKDMLGRRPKARRDAGAIMGSKESSD
jgi:hypothetical protein